MAKFEPEETPKFRVKLPESSLPPMFNGFMINLLGRA